MCVVYSSVYSLRPPNFFIRLELTDCAISEKEVLDMVGKLPKLNVRLALQSSFVNMYCRA